MDRSSKFSVMSIDVLVLVKALAISLVVASHSGIAPELHGGLNALLVVSGISMATFAFEGFYLPDITGFLAFYSQDYCAQFFDCSGLGRRCLEYQLAGAYIYQ